MVVLIHNILILLKRSLIEVKLFEFAFCPDFKNKINGLALICPENWGKHDGHKDHPILHNYIKHTFSKLYDDYDKAIQEDKGKFIKIEEGRYLVFNTGLYNGRITTHD